MAKELLDIRKEIDIIDSEILRLLGKRFEYAVRTRRFKSQLTDEQREHAILNAARNNSRWLVSAEFSESLFQTIMAESRFQQGKNLTLVGFAGVHGALAETCVEKISPEAVPIPYASNDALFQSLEAGTIDIGIIPFERVCDTAAQISLSLFLESTLSIQADVTVPISYALMTLPEADYREVKAAYGHPEILARSEKFLTRAGIQPVPYYESAAAALMLRQDQPPAAGVIAPTFAAQVYNLTVLKDEVDEDNYKTARFLLIGKNDSTNGEKSMILFSTNHTSGTLSQVLDIFSKEKINLLKIESLSNTRSEENRVPFLLEFEGSTSSKTGAAALQALTDKKIQYKLLGSYKSIL